jgi:hypothetical protein
MEAAARTTFRQLMRAVRWMPWDSAERAAAVHRVRAGFHAAAAVRGDAEAVAALHRVAESKLAFARSQIPARDHRRVFGDPLGRADEGGRSARYAYDAAAGEVRPVGSHDAAAASSWNVASHGVDPEALQHHQRLLRRMNFREPPPSHVIEKIRRDQAGPRMSIRD